MIVEYIWYAIPRRREVGFRRAYAEAAAILQAHPRCLSYEVSQSVYEPTRFLVRIEWNLDVRQLESVRRDPAFADGLTVPC